MMTYYCNYVKKMFFVVHQFGRK